MITRIVNALKPKAPLTLDRSYIDSPDPTTIPRIGLIAGNGPFPIKFVQEALRYGCVVTAVCHEGETDPAIEKVVNGGVTWIRVGQLGAMIQAFLAAGVQHAAMAGGISRVKHFSDVKFDARGAAMMLRIRSMKDDLIMRGIADELAKDGVTVIPCTTFLSDQLVPQGVLTKSRPAESELRDIEVGHDALRVLGAQHIGQLVVVRDGVIVAVEAVEGTNAAIERGGDLGGPGTVVVKCAKPTQDMRFDVPTVGKRTIEVLIAVKARVLALEAHRTLLIDREEVLALADQHGIAIIGTQPLVES